MRMRKITRKNEKRCMGNDGFIPVRLRKGVYHCTLSIVHGEGRGWEYSWGEEKENIPEELSKKQLEKP